MLYGVGGVSNALHDFEVGSNAHRESIETVIFLIIEKGNDYDGIRNGFRSSCSMPR